MKKYFKKSSLLFLLALVFLGSCRNENVNNRESNSRVVKYEITGNFTGKLKLIYNDNVNKFMFPSKVKLIYNYNVNGNTVVNNVALPFFKDITYPAFITGIGIGAQTSIPGVAGQTATMKIYSGGNVAKTVSATAGSLGELVLPTLAYTF